MVSSSQPSTSSGPRDTWATTGSLTSYSRYRSPAICQIVIYDKEEPENDDAGTGFLIGKNLIMTNNHVISSKKVAETARAFFYYDTLANTRGSPHDVFPVELNPYEEHGGYFYPSLTPGKEPLDEQHLDFTIVALKEHPKLNAIAERAFSILNTGAPKEGTIALIGHPGGTDPNRSLEGEKTCEPGEIKEVESFTLHHNAKVEYGVSGAPLINYKGELVGVHRVHPKTSCRAHGEECSYGISIEAIKSHLGEGGLAKIEKYLDDPSKTLLIKKLKVNYSQKDKIPLLLGGDLSIENHYIQLAVIGESEQQEKKSKLEKIKPGQVEDGRIPTHESFFEPKKPIKLEDLFNHKYLKNLAEKQAIIYGSAGIGKSTLCQFIAYKWAKGELWPQFDHLFWIRLRNLNKQYFPPGQKYRAAHIIAQECELDIEIVERLIRDPSFRERSLLLLDGEDELPPEAASEDREAYLNPAFKELTRKFSQIIVTSRPQLIISTTTKFQLEILGFDGKGIDQYVDRFFEDNDRNKVLLYEQLKNPLIRSLAHIPINLEIFCSLVKQGMPLFTSGKPPTITSIYKTVTDWFYRRFLIEKTSIKTATARSDPDPSEDPEVKKIVLILEEIAWEAMQNNTLYLSEKSITQICRKFGFRNSEELKNLGPLRIKDRLGYFIHLTFQEYFAAGHLARFYLKEKSEEGLQQLKEIKFDPKYSITLPMIAGHLSEQNNSKALQSFFDGLFAEPRDLAKSYELRLFAQCFEECTDPTQLNQYQKFIENVVEYIKKAPLQEMNFQLLNRNTKLLDQGNVVDTILEAIEDETKQENTFKLLRRLAQEKVIFPQKLINKLLEKARDPFLDGNARESAFKAIEEVIKAEQTISSEVLKVLIQMARDSLPNSLVGKRATEVLKDVVHTKQMISTEALKALIQLVTDTQLDRDVRNEAVCAIAYDLRALKALVNMVLNPSTQMISSKALEKVIQTGQTLYPEMLNALVQVAADPMINIDVRMSAVYALATTAEAGKTLPSNFQKILVEIVKDPQLDSTVKESAVYALGAMAKVTEAILPETFKAIIQILENINPDDKPMIDTNDIGYALAKFAKAGHPFPLDVLQTLIDIGKNPNLHIRIRAGATFALGQIAGARQEGATQAMNALIQMATDPNLKNRVRASANYDLGKAIRVGKPLPLEAIDALVKIVTNPSLKNSIRSGAAFALAQVVILAALIEMSKDPKITIPTGASLSEYLGPIKDEQQPLPPKILNVLIAISKDTSVIHGGIQKHIISALELKARQTRAPKALKGLVQMAADPSFVQSTAADALVKIVKEGEAPLLKILKGLIKEFLDSNLDSKMQKDFIFLLVEIGKLEQAFTPELLNNLAEMLKNPNLDRDTQYKVISSLVKISRVEHELYPKVKEILVEMIKNLNFNLLDVPNNFFNARLKAYQATKALGHEAYHLANHIVGSLNLNRLDSQTKGFFYAALSKAAETNLALCYFKDTDQKLSDKKRIAAYTLGKIARMGCDIPPEKIVTLAQMTTELSSVTEAFKALEKIAERQVFPQEAVRVLVQMTKDVDPSFDSYRKSSTIKILKKLQLSQLHKMIVNNQVFKLVKELCSMTNSALAISGNKMILSNSREKQSFHIPEGIDLDDLELMQTREFDKLQGPWPEDHLRAICKKKAYFVPCITEKDVLPKVGFEKILMENSQLTPIVILVNHERHYSLIIYDPKQKKIYRFNSLTTEANSTESVLIQVMTQNFNPSGIIFNKITSQKEKDGISCTFYVKHFLESFLNGLSIEDVDAAPLSQELLADEVKQYGNSLLVRLNLLKNYIESLNSDIFESQKSQSVMSHETSDFFFNKFNLKNLFEKSFFNIDLSIFS